MRLFFLLIGFLFLCARIACAADAVPAAAYFPVLPLDAPADATPQFLPIAASHALDGIHNGITRAIIVIHDQSRDAGAALGLISALAGEANGSSIIIAPQFLLPSDIVNFADHLPNKGHEFAAWQMEAWKSGDDSMAMPGHKGVSSFTVIDLLSMYVADRHAFPDLRDIIIIGFGAGADFAQRYAAFGMAADVLIKENINPRFVVAGADSYLYQTANRPLGGRKGFGVPDLKACPDYNAYPYGLERLTPYARRVGLNAAKINYAMRSIAYLAAPVPAADTNCAAQIQGSDSASRASNYQFYLQSLYGDIAARTQIFNIAKDGKGDAANLLGSACGMEMLFGDGLCANNNATGNP